MIRNILLVAFLVFFSSCSSKKDVLGIGKSPNPPTKSKGLKLVSGPNLSAKLQHLNTDNKASDTSTPNLLLFANDAASKSSTSDPLSIMSPEGGVLTLWALNPGNWVWGYSLNDSIDFGSARIWRIHTDSNGNSIIENVKKKTCLTAYANGVVHTYCDSKNTKQLWKFNLFDNQAVQIQNVGTQQCLQTPSKASDPYFFIYLTDCVKSGKKNSDQQWVIIAEPLDADIVFSVN
ncbi:MAG: RICIN domain-containing protein [Helicobacter sp.]|nr:RICIN domain-containing protein [Helicobacter sp.]MCI7484489.1 RICIN domain-containing protein [Helicobacter sp.]MDD7567653.1 RICIN domain-containing protein [Helicobacter sp.]MDY5740294.1 RICIN domain-containing protein [Helicobacter sp.]